MAGVDPFGNIYPTVAKNGTLMGNRGVLRKRGEPAIVRQWQTPRWIYCTCKGEKAEGRAYTKLFFMDEAAALSAGHRPCSSCLKKRFDTFKAAWVAGNPDFRYTLKTNIKLIDQELERERKNDKKGKRTFLAPLDELPEGVMVSLESRPGEAFVYRSGKLYVWTKGGFRGGIVAPQGIRVEVLTPRSIVNAIRCGFSPDSDEL
jgi:hypothetical protein